MHRPDELPDALVLTSRDYLSIEDSPHGAQRRSSVPGNAHTRSVHVCKISHHARIHSSITMKPSKADQDLFQTITSRIPFGLSLARHLAIHDIDPLPPVDAKGRRTLDGWRVVFEGVVQDGALPGPSLALTCGDRRGSAGMVRRVGVGKGVDAQTGPISSVVYTEQPPRGSSIRASSIPYASISPKRRISAWARPTRPTPVHQRYGTSTGRSRAAYPPRRCARSTRRRSGVHPCWLVCLSR